MARPIWFVNLIKKTFPNVKSIAKLTKVPVIGKLINNLLFKGDDIIYLTQDKIIPVNKEVIKQSDMILPSSVVEYFIKKAKHHCIMNFCICRDSMKCNDYPIELGCLFLGEGVLDINPEIGRLVSEQEALEHARKCREAGLVHMIGRNKLDKQWLGVSDGEKLLSICSCCPCCCLWRVAPVISHKIGSKVTKMPGVEINVTDKCIGCGTCTEGICFVDAIHVVDDRAVINEECRACGRCVDICPQSAFELIISDPDYIKNSISRIDKLVDLS